MKYHKIINRSFRPHKFKMKKKYYSLSILLLLFNPAYSQKKTYEDIFKERSIYVFGYDFSRFKFVEPKRSDQGKEIKENIYGWVGWMNEHYTTKTFKGWFRKDTAIFSFNAINKINQEINPASIVAQEFESRQRYVLPKESLQEMVNKYELTEKEGLGFVCIIESFYKPKNEVSAYFVFFDIATKQILDATRFVNRDADGYGLVRYWGTGLGITFKEYFSNVYKKNNKKYN